MLPLLWEHALLPRSAAVRRLDLMHFPNPTAPLGMHIPFVATVHDTAIFDHPEWFPSGQSFSTRTVVPRTMRRARRLLAVTETVKHNVMNRFGVPDEKISVIPNGVNTEVFSLERATVEQTLKKFHLDPGYILWVGRPAPYKNLAFVNTLVQSSEKRFVFVGMDAHEARSAMPAYDETRCTCIASIEPGSRELADLYRGAGVVIQPSLYESFALPVLEALACGTPAIVSDMPTLREIYGNMLEYAPLADLSVWQKKIDRSITNETGRQERSAWAQKYAWQKIAESVSAQYAAVLGERK
jgi:glycosyltransferase involved in cell wall biosynthesis